MLKPLTFLTFWTTLIFIALIALQWFPYTGIFLMMFGAMIWVGYMPHVIMASITIDILTRSKNKALLIIPILPYLVYYSFWGMEQVQISNIAQSIRDQNPSEIIEYNPEVHSLVMTYGASTGKHYKIPASFEPNPNFPEGYMSYRLLTQDLCKKMKGTRDFVHTFGVIWRRSERYQTTEFANLCQLRMPELPRGQLLAVSTQEIKDKTPKLLKTEYSFSLNGEELGKFYSADYAALPVFPKFIIGCFLISSSPEWKCLKNIQYTKRSLETYPEGDVSEKYGDWVVAKLLKIEKYKKEDLDLFENYPDTLEVVHDLIDKKENQRPEDFNEWGVRKNSLYIPEISVVNGYPSFKGGIFAKKEGGEFYSFMKKHEGEIVYIDATIDSNVNTSRRGFGLYAVCKPGKGCLREDKRFNIKSGAAGSRYSYNDRLITGYWRVGKEVVTNEEDNDTAIELKAISVLVIKEKLDRVKNSSKN